MALSSQKSSSVLSDDCWFSTIGVKQNLLECHIILTAFVLKPLLKHKNIKKMKVYSLIIYTFCTTNHQNCFQQTVLHSFQSNVINTLNVTCSLWIMSPSFIFSVSYNICMYLWNFFNLCYCAEIKVWSQESPSSVIWTSSFPCVNSARSFPHISGGQTQNPDVWGGWTSSSPRHSELQTVHRSCSVRLVGRRHRGRQVLMAWMPCHMHHMSPLLWWLETVCI